MLCVHSLPIYDAFHDGLVSIEKGAELKRRWPDRIIWYAAVDVLQGEKALDAMEYQVKELGADGIKLYPAQYYRGRTRGWRMDDYVLAFPVFEFAQELGVKNVAIHKALPLGPVDDNPYNVDDIGGAAQAFPDLNFQIVHGGLMFVERTQMLLANHPNVYATLEATTLVAVFDPPRFAHTMDAFLQVAPDKVIYSSAGMVSHPSYVLEALDKYEGNLVPVTDEMRNDIMGGTLARLHGIDVEERRKKIADDEFSREKREKGLREPYSTLRERWPWYERDDHSGPHPRGRLRGAARGQGPVYGRCRPGPLHRGPRPRLRGRGGGRFGRGADHVHRAGVHVHPHRDDRRLRRPGGAAGGGGGAGDADLDAGVDPGAPQRQGRSGAGPGSHLREDEGAGDGPQGRRLTRSSVESGRALLLGKLDGKVAFVTGAARGQGRSHALRLAEEGADIIAVDICEQMEVAPYPLATPEDLQKTARLVEDLDRRCVARRADVRDLGQMEEAVREGVSELGHVDVVCANAGINYYALLWELTEQQWREMIDTNLTGTWHTIKATVPHMIEADRGGSIIFTSSVFGLKGGVNFGHYAAAKHGVMGLMKTLALELAPHMIRVNAINPTQVETDLILNDTVYRLLRPDLEKPTLDDAREVFTALNAMPIPWVEPRDVSEAVLWLASDESRYVTGVALPVDAGALLR